MQQSDPNGVNFRIVSEWCKPQTIHSVGKYYPCKHLIRLFFSCWLNIFFLRMLPAHGRNIRLLEFALLTVKLCENNSLLIILTSYFHPLDLWLRKKISHLTNRVSFLRLDWILV